MAASAPPEGIPRELARQRAQRVSDVRYALNFTLEPGKSAPGHARISFRLKGAGPLLLDFRGENVAAVRVNGRGAPPFAVNGHIELPAESLREGENSAEMYFMAPVEAAGRALTRFVDRDDNSEYIYTLFVPMDASMAFPCFDQPDLKARFTLELTVPETWTAISNTVARRTVSLAGHAKMLGFGESEPISTYLFAFAAGPFRRVGPASGRTTMWVRQSKLKRAEDEAGAVLGITDRGIEQLSSYFAQPFPFSKYDLVLLPGFAYGGMEHAGATFLREESILFRTVPTLSDRMNRSILLLHELTHQWFGDLVTMRWFDDLWLKEGFATYMAYHALDTLEPRAGVWKRFYQSTKPAAYGIDITPGTTPIYQEIGNLKDAKSAYGAIVYSKAPGMLRQLAYVLGESAFRDGVRQFLKEHAYGNAQWDDLVRAFEASSGRKLGAWADAWIRRRGMPEVTVDWACSVGRISRFTLAQRNVLGEPGAWPLASEVLLAYDGAAPVRLRASFDAASAPLKDAIGKPCPAYVFANDQDYGYGLYLLDARSRAAVRERIGRVQDDFERTLLWGALWDAVRQVQMPPGEYVALVRDLAPAESDEALLQSMMARAVTALHRYMDAADLAAAMERLAGGRMQSAATADQRIVWYRAFRSLAQTPGGMSTLKRMLDGEVAIAGMEIKPLDRWNMVTALLAGGDPEAEERLATERKRDQTGEGRKYAYVAEAARPNAATKKEYFDDYLHNRTRPEDWVEQSLGAFNWWSESALTLPYVRPALDALPLMKRERKIFFVLAWLNAFLGGHQSAEAEEVVQDFLKSAALDRDLRLKVLEVNDELQRAVRIRGAKF